MNFKFQNGGSTGEDLAKKIFTVTNALQIPENIVASRLTALAEAKDVETLSLLQASVDAFIKSNGQDQESAQNIISIFQPKGMFKCGGKLQQLASKFKNGGDCGCVKVADKGDKIVNAGLRSATKAAKKVADSGRAKNRKVGFAKDANNGQHWFESASVGGNTANTHVYIPAPGDTIITQKIATPNG